MNRKIRRIAVPLVLAAAGSAATGLAAAAANAHQSHAATVEHLSAPPTTATRGAAPGLGRELYKLQKGDVYEMPVMHAGRVSSRPEFPDARHMAAYVTCIAHHGFDVRATGIERDDEGVLRQFVVVHDPDAYRPPVMRSGSGGFAWERACIKILK